ncbi:glycoside hydrolase family 53 protein [Truepera radiovictrix]|uniref:Arabinogalactan endo-beta-1,4-galactanase n=1 Tax=Truepera radiovictrix (strain DSM 17093 / CIP 108686 / LMG 22925 / RQ-24) TaxID=649638 RepID=D7CR64_TRURR|nr:glycosyl hydrolase 53 family protein [Truepera radiovictrix]ADI15152.1 Arabinogalactan endo-1,4-beta-galactosidase [Truepera radiovictrix DSM 17093]WMT56295.1 glycosyl hydrolase 53 family protein [Truepera radiovictrix]
MPQTLAAQDGVAYGQSVRGADVSTLQKVEDHGGRFYGRGAQKTPQDPLVILRSHGVNYVRLKLWKDPVGVDGYNDLEKTVAMAKRAKRTGLRLLLNFHYSDFWADPGRQDKPAAWRDLSFEALTRAVYDHTVETMTALKAARALPDIVQIGNEIQSGILWPDGKTWGEGSGGFDNLAILLRAGIDGVRDVVGKDVKIMLHLADGADNGLYRWWFDEITRRGITDFDIIGLSFYPYWHGTLQGLSHNLADISARYDKDVIVVETAYAFTLADGDGHPNIFGAAQAQAGGYPATVAGQAAFIEDIRRVVQAVPGGRGLGVFYWEPTWLPVPGAGWRSGEGNAWENQALFDFDGRALTPSLEALGRPLPTLKRARAR